MKKAIVFLLFLCSLFCAGAEKPIVRIGIITDTHIGKTEKSLRFVKKTFELYKQENPEYIIHVGDLGDHYYESGYDFYRKTYNDVFGAKGPKQLFVFANHDTIDMRDKVKAWAGMQKHIGFTQNTYHKEIIHGYPFLFYPQWIDLKRMEKEIQQAIKDFPGKPVFVIDHVPPRDTTYNSRVWGHGPRRTIFERYPQTVVISGHTHNSLYNEQSIWQGKFTAVDAGCLQVWDGALVGNPPKNKRSNEVLILEIFPKKLLFRRYSIDTKKEICADRVWSVPLPFNPKNAPYNPAYRRAHSPVPAFAANAKFKVSFKGKPCKEVKFSFDEARHPEGTFYYMIETARKNSSGKWEKFARKDEFGNFWKGGKIDNLSIEMDGGFFDSNCEYQVMVTPYNFYGAAGKALVRTFRTPEMLKGKLLYESRNPMVDCPYMTELVKGKRIAAKDGFFSHPGGNTRLEFPQGIWQGPKGKKFRFTVDMVTEQPEDSQWTIVLRNPAPLVNANARISTPPGKYHCLRYVITFKKRQESYWYYFLLREGKPGKVRFNYVKIEELP